MWQKQAGHQHNHIDGRTLQHNVHLFNPVTGGEHHLVLLLGLPTCAQCKRPFPQSDLGLLDPDKAIEEALRMLNPHHEQLMAYSKRHGVPIVLGDLHQTVPDGHRLVKVDGQRILLPK